jgi:hypothetical protein
MLKATINTIGLTIVIATRNKFQLKTSPPKVSKSIAITSHDCVIKSLKMI